MDAIEVTTVTLIADIALDSNGCPPAGFYEFLMQVRVVLIQLVAFPGPGFACGEANERPLQ
jgi:hypothetical protein